MSSIHNLHGKGAKKCVSDCVSHGNRHTRRLDDFANAETCPMTYLNGCKEIICNAVLMAHSSETNYHDLCTVSLQSVVAGLRSEKEGQPNRPIAHETTGDNLPTFDVDATLCLRYRVCCLGLDLGHVGPAKQNTNMEEAVSNFEWVADYPIPRQTE